MRHPWTALAALLCSCASTQPQKMPWQHGPAPAPRASAAPAREPAPTPALEVFEIQSVRREVYHPVAFEDRVEPSALRFEWTLAATGINSLFGARPDPIGGGTRFHHGVDLEAEYGALVSAAAEGVVDYAGWNAGHGRQVVLSHAGGYSTVYSHLSQVLVFAGTRVGAGQAIGRVGNSGRSTGPHLHFEVTRDGARLDPLTVLGARIDLDGDEASLR